MIGRRAGLVTRVTRRDTFTQPYLRSNCIALHFADSRCFLGVKFDVEPATPFSIVVLAENLEDCSILIKFSLNLDHRSSLPYWRSLPGNLEHRSSLAANFLLLFLDI